MWNLFKQRQKYKANICLNMGRSEKSWMYTVPSIDYLRNTKVTVCIRLLIYRNLCMLYVSYRLLVSECSQQ